LEEEKGIDFFLILKSRFAFVFSRIRIRPTTRKKEFLSTSLAVENTHHQSIMFLSRQGTRFFSRNLTRWSVGSHVIPSATTTTTSGPFRCFSSSLKESYENIIVETPEEGGGKVAVVKLHRPKALNALNDALFKDLIHATSVLDEDEGIRCMVLTGSSPKAFAAGADISEMKDKTFEEVYNTDMFSEWQTVSKLGGTPIIAAVSGYCLGGGSELAMMCDIMVCSKSAKVSNFVDAHVGFTSLF
jgi:hypothetical protein